MSEEWQDRYYPADFNGRAGTLAKKYCKQHPEADKQTVYYAATEAVEIYEKSTKYRKYKFEDFAYWRIRNALYMQCRKENISMTPETKAAIIRDLIAGASKNDIIGKYKCNPSTLDNNIFNWRKRGLLPTASELTINKVKEDAIPTRSADLMPETPKAINIADIKN